MDTINSQDVPTKVRKPYTITKQREKWTEDDHTKFLEALKLHGRAWRRIEDHIGTKTTIQIRSHAQKFFSKIERGASFPGLLGKGSSREIQIPPPRPKRRPCHPYPKKALCETNQTTRNSSFAEAYSKTFPDFHSPTMDCVQIDSLRSHEEHLSDVSSPASNSTSCISDHSPRQEDATSSDTSSEKHETLYRLAPCEKDLDAAPTANIIGDSNENKGDNPPNDIAHEQGITSISSFRPTFNMANYSSMYIPVLLLPHTFSYNENEEAKVTAFGMATMAQNMSIASTNWQASSRVLYNPKPILASLWKPQEREPKRNITNHQEFDEEYEQLNAHRGEVECLDNLVNIRRSLDVHDVAAITKQQYTHEKTRIHMTCHSIKGNTHGEKGLMHCGNGKFQHYEDYSTKMDSKNSSVKMTGEESEVYNQALETEKADHMPLCQIRNEESQLSNIHTQVYVQTCQDEPSLEIDRNRNHKSPGRTYQSHGASNQTTVSVCGPRNNETSSLTFISNAPKCIFRATSYSGDGFIPYRRPC